MLNIRFFLNLYRDLYLRGKTAVVIMSHQPPVSCIPNTAKMSKAKKVIEEAKEINNPEIDLVDKGLSSLDEIPGLCK